jgi:hypothetical protein
MFCFFIFTKIINIDSVFQQYSIKIKNINSIHSSDKCQFDRKFSSKSEKGQFWKDEQIAKALYVSRMTVDRTRKSLVEEGLEPVQNLSDPV